MATTYNQALLAPGRKKSMQRRAGHVNVDEDRVEQFVRESPWEYERLQVHLNRNIPGTIRSENGAFIVDEVGITKQGRHSVGNATSSLRCFSAIVTIYRKSNSFPLCDDNCEGSESSSVPNSAFVLSMAASISCTPSMRGSIFILVIPSFVFTSAVRSGRFLISSMSSVPSIRATVGAVSLPSLSVNIFRKWEEIDAAIERTKAEFGTEDDSLPSQLSSHKGKLFDFL